MAEDSVTVETQLRQELKDWERAFCADNGGRKPSNKDIKANATIGMSSFRLVNPQ
jgi:hypothetical protein